MQQEGDGNITQVCPSDSLVEECIAQVFGFPSFTKGGGGSDIVTHIFGSSWALPAWLSLAQWCPPSSLCVLPLILPRKYSFECLVSSVNGQMQRPVSPPPQCLSTLTRVAVAIYPHCLKVPPPPPNTHMPCM